MRLLTSTTLLLAIAHSAAAQPPRPPGRGSGGTSNERGAAPSAEAFVSQLMSLDTNQDGQLTREEVTDVRLHPLLTRADANKDGSVSADELKELYARESAALGNGRGPGQPGGGAGGGPMGAGGQMGPGGPGEMPRPGEVLPAFLQDELRLTERQREQVAALQKDVDARLKKILTAEQRAELSRMRERGPGGPGVRGDNGRPMPGDEGDQQGRRPPAE